MIIPENASEYDIKLLELMKQRDDLRHLKDYFGRKRLADIKTRDVERFLIQLREDGFSDSQQSKCKGMLFQIYKKAMANDLVNKNPVAYSDKLKHGPVNEKLPFTLEEIQQLSGAY